MKWGLKTTTSTTLTTFLLGCLLMACSSIECPVQNTVYTVYELADTLHDTLTVTSRRADGIDTTLLNSSVNPTVLNLPISYRNPVDTLVFTTQRLAVTDTVWVAKDDIPHFESVDCNASFFHRLTSVSCTYHGIDSIRILHSTVDYDPSNAHIRIRFKARP
ncbi:MAG: hypothetical protein IJ841_06425 [Prevotella sp.]|nr:hypothetical protein [Prevotella sp.]